MANPEKESENDGGGEIRKNFFTFKIKTRGLTRNYHMIADTQVEGLLFTILHLRKWRHQGSEGFSQAPDLWWSWDQSSASDFLFVSDQQG